MPSIVLVPGHWLGAWAWDAVASELRLRGHHVVAVTLPGLDPQDPDRTTRALSDQVDALRLVVAEVAATRGAPVLVAHSGAGYPTSGLIDRDPAAVTRIIYVDSGPAAGGAFDPSLPLSASEVPLPPFDQLSASLDGLTADDLARFRELAVPQPGPAMREPLHLTNDARRDVPATIIACSIPSGVISRMAREGNPMFAEVSTLRRLEWLDLPTGHWPMWSRPVDLAAAISGAARDRSEGVTADASA